MICSFLLIVKDLITELSELCLLKLQHQAMPLAFVQSNM
jgi:hypothetical protein